MHHVHIHCVSNAAGKVSLGAVDLQLTGNLPFLPSPEDEQYVAPDYVPEDRRQRWEEFEAILRLHEAYVSLAMVALPAACLCLLACKEQRS